MKMTGFEDAVMQWRMIRQLCTVMTAVWTAAAAVLFFKLHILEVFGTLTGRNAGKAFRLAQIPGIDRGEPETEAETYEKNGTEVMFSVERSLVIIHADEVS